MERLITDQIASQVNDLFSGLSGTVEIVFFSKQENCEYCGEIEQLITEVAELTEKIATRILDIEKDHSEAEKYNVLEAPTLVILARDGEEIIDFGVRLLGAPAGHEFTSLIHDILMVSNQKTDLSDATREFLQGLDKPLLLQVFVTPTCPYCPQAVLLAHKMAMESEWVQAEMVESTEFYDLASKYQVSGVPQTTINSGAGRVVGAVPEKVLVEQIQQAMGY